MDFQADTFEEIARMSQSHGMGMIQKGDKAHIAAMNDMRKMMQSPGAMNNWMENKKSEFNKLPDC